MMELELKLTWYDRTARGNLHESCAFDIDTLKTEKSRLELASEVIHFAQNAERRHAKFTVRLQEYEGEET
jgi:hypothetical protein